MAALLSDRRPWSVFILCGKTHNASQVHCLPGTATIYIVFKRGPMPSKEIDSGKTVCSKDSALSISYIADFGNRQGIGIVCRTEHSMDVLVVGGQPWEPQAKLSTSHEAKSRGQDSAMIFTHLEISRPHLSPRKPRNLGLGGHLVVSYTRSRVA